MSEETASVLVVDDDSGLRMLSRVVLELEGFRVREASSIAEAEAAIADRRPDVVLLDVHLGLEESTPLFRSLRAAGIPVAAVTGTADPSEYETSPTSAAEAVRAVGAGRGRPQVLGR